MVKKYLTFITSLLIINITSLLFINITSLLSVKITSFSCHAWGPPMKKSGGVGIALCERRGVGIHEI